MHYSPVRHYHTLAHMIVRLACVKHAASVHSESGSNSSYITSKLFYHIKPITQPQNSKVIHLNNYL